MKRGRVGEEGRGVEKGEGQTGKELVWGLGGGNGAPVVSSCLPALSEPPRVISPPCEAGVTWAYERVSEGSLEARARRGGAWRGDEGGVCLPSPLLPRIMCLLPCILPLQFPLLSPPHRSPPIQYFLLSLFSFFTTHIFIFTPFFSLSSIFPVLFSLPFFFPPSPRCHMRPSGAFPLYPWAPMAFRARASDVSISELFHTRSPCCSAAVGKGVCVGGWKGMACGGMWLEGKD